MDNTKYFEDVSRRFKKREELQLGQFNVNSFYEEEFKVEWIATKLKIFSFVSEMNKIDYGDIVQYSSVCVDYALKNYKGMPRGLQNGLVTFNVLISKNVSDKAIDFAIARPKKRFAAFEMPVIYDLSKEELYYYKENPIWGRIYYEYFRDYIEENFKI